MGSVGSVGSVGGVGEVGGWRGGRLQLKNYRAAIASFQNKIAADYRAASGATLLENKIGAAVLKRRYTHQ